MTNEKTNPMPYRAADAAAMPAAAGAAEAAGPDMAAPVITPDDVARGTELLRRYKDGKRALEARIIADEQWYRLRHWQYLRDRRREQGADVVEPTSAWLFNAIVSKHADAMDSFPEAVILPRSEQDEPDAKALSAIVPAVLEKTHFEQVWSDAWWYKLKHGCAAYGVFWDSAGSNGLGDVAVRQLDLLNLFWEPGITDIQASRNLFVCALMDNDDISAAWPDARPGSCGVELAQYLYDDAVDTSSKSIVVDWYYKKPLPGGGTALHLIKFTGRDLLYASENDPAMAGGFYPHGQYPVVFDVLYPEAGTPCGFGMIAVSKDPQQYIDRLSGNLLEMSMKASTPRFWVKKGCGVNAQEFLDWSKPLVEVEGSIDDERLRQISLYNLDGQWVNMLQLKIDELKETSNSRDVTQGSVSGGVTAASAIAALQEAGSKSSRDTLRASYRAFERVVELVIELIRAYYTETRPFRVAAPGAQGYAFCTYSNAGLQARTVGMDADGMALLRAPAFDVSVHAQKESPYATASQNELARQLYQLGVFNPAFAQQAVPMLEMMQFPGRDKVLEAVTVGALRCAIERKAQQRARRAAEESAARWSREADELAAQCPDFDLGAALSDAQFCALLRAGVDVRTAWFALHAQALLEAACVRAGRSAEQRVAEHIRARGLRPAENGLGGGGAGIVMRPDVSRMSRADRAALAARAERGERVKLSL